MKPPGKPGIETHAIFPTHHQSFWPPSSPTNEAHLIFEPNNQKGHLSQGSLRFCLGRFQVPHPLLRVQPRVIPTSALRLKAVSQVAPRENHSSSMFFGQKSIYMCVYMCVPKLAQPPNGKNKISFPLPAHLYGSVPKNIFLFSAKAKETNGSLVACHIPPKAPSSLSSAMPLRPESPSRPVMHAPSQNGGPSRANNKKIKLKKTRENKKTAGVQIMICADKMF